MSSSWREFGSFLFECAIERSVADPWIRRTSRTSFRSRIGAPTEIPAPWASQRQLCTDVVALLHSGHPRIHCADPNIFSIALRRIPVRAPLRTANSHCLVRSHQSHACQERQGKLLRYELGEYEEIRMSVGGFILILREQHSKTATKLGQ